MIGPHHQYAGQFAVGAGQGGQANTGHTGNFAQEFLEPVQQFQGPLTLLLWLQRVDGGKSGQEGHLVINLGVVLHGAAAQGIELGIDGKV